MDFHNSIIVQYQKGAVKKDESGSCDLIGRGRGTIMSLMDWNVVFFLNSILLGTGLAMDAFSVSLANGLKEPDMRSRRMCLIAGTFAMFQGIMPLLGYTCVHTILQLFTAFEAWIPWIAMLLLGAIGIKMIVEGVRKKASSEEIRPMGYRELFLMGIATSIDALSVGFTIADYGLIMALVCVLIIAAVTFLICYAGLHFGKKLGMRLSDKAQIFGGVILIAIGLEILLKSLFF